MKLYAFALVLGGFIAVSSAVEEPCTNRLSEEVCVNSTTRFGCQNLKIRWECRLECEVCDGYENLRAGQHVAMLYAGNHILTFDRVPFDANTRGEHVLYWNLRTGMRVNALFTRPEGVENSVTTAVGVIEGQGRPRLQIAVDLAASVSASATRDCKMAFWHGNKRLTDEQVEKLGGYAGIAKIDEKFERHAYKMDLRSPADEEHGPRISIAVRYQSQRGCYLDKVELFITTSQLEGSRGLMGTPDDNIYNEWHTRQGGFWRLPPFAAGRYLVPAFNYVKFNWCVKFKSGSLIRYDGLGSFEEHVNCGDAPYEGLRSFASATPAMRTICGAFNFECLHDSIALPSETDGRKTNLRMVFAETATVPALEGLSAEPRGVLNGAEMTVRITVTLNRKVTDLNGFALAELDDNNLSRTGRVVSFLSDDGNSANGDEDQFDGVYTTLFSVKLGNGVSKGYYVFPLIKGTFRDDREDLIFALPNTVRGYSPQAQSGRQNISQNDLYFEMSNILPVEIYVSYIWRENLPQVETATTFLNDTVGTFCTPEDPYLEHQGAQASSGGVTKVKIRLHAAFRDNKFDTSASIGFYGVKTGPQDTLVKITVIAKRFSDGKVISGSFLSMDVEPDRKQYAQCAAQQPGNLLGRLTIQKTRTWRFTLEKESG